MRPPGDQFWREHPEFAHRAKEDASYNIAFQQLAISAVGVRAFFTVVTNADFVMTQVDVNQLTAGNAAYSINPVDVMFVNDSTGRPITNIALDILSLCGGGVLTGPAMPWPWPVIVPRGSQFSAIATNTNAGAVVQNLFFTFQGVHVFA